MKRLIRDCGGAKFRRRGVAAVEFAVCFPVLLFILLGLWEVGRITEVQQVMWNSAREAARDASLGQNNLKTVATNLLTYLQSAEPTAFGKGHSTTLKAPVVTLPANTTGYTCWDTTANRELFTLTFTDLTNPTLTDPTALSQLDRYEIGVQVPYASIGWLPVPQITGKSRLYVAVDWAAMVDAPFQIAPYLPAQ
jgi:Flp pilus assembly protein TadG